MAELQSFYDPERDDPPLSRVADAALRLYPVERQRRAEGVEGPDEPEYVETTVRAAVADGVVANEWTAYYLSLAREWLASVGLDPDRLRFRQHREGELAHYAEDCWDAEALLPTGDGAAADPEAAATADPETADPEASDDRGTDWIELAGIADRADNDLVHHADATEESFTVFREYDEPRTERRVRVDPDMSVLGPAFGDRAPAVVAAIEARAREDPGAFDDGEVTLDVEPGTDPADPASAAGTEPAPAEDADPASGRTVTVDAEDVAVRVESVTDHGEHVRPSVVEPAFGVDRVVYAALAHSLRTDRVEGEERTYLALPPDLAPTPAAVLPLTDGLEDRARDLSAACRRAGLAVEYDDSGSIGRRYRRQDEVGTPFCVTLDRRTAEDDTVTVRERDTTDQVRVPAAEVPELLAALRAGRRSFDDLREGPSPSGTRTDSR